MIRRMWDQLKHDPFSPASVILFIIVAAAAVAWLPGFLQGLIK